ncbi:MAG: T9SS type A sorting domain-containing protein [Ignavibacteriae bacterium]|nr:T9SS type A sorting domain-containing protein [Ignavibacteriota bacterium]
MTLATVWNTAFTNVTTITLNGSPISTSTTTHNATYTVDGYGTMRLPNTTQAVYAMRIRKLNLYNGTPVVSFIFISRGGAQVACEASDTSARSGVINVRKGTVVWNPSMTTDSTTDVRTSEAIPASFALEQNYPNPFNPVTTINYELSNDNSQLTILKVYDLLGREVATLVNEEKPAGTYRVEFDAGNLPSGVYYYRLTTGSFTQTRKMILAK